MTFRDNAFEELAGHLLARMRGLRALHLCISYVPALPSLIGLTHLELHAVVFSGVQACTASPVTVLCAGAVCIFSRRLLEPPRN